MQGFFITILRLHHQKSINFLLQAIFKFRSNLRRTSNLDSLEIELLYYLYGIVKKFNAVMAAAATAAPLI